MAIDVDIDDLIESVDYNKLLTPRFKENEVWTTMFDAWSSINKEAVHAPRRTLETIRDPYIYHVGDTYTVDDTEGIITDIIQHGTTTTTTPEATLSIEFQDGTTTTETAVNIKDKALLILEAQHLGMSFYADYLSQDHLARIVEFLHQYAHRIGTKDYVNFMSFIKNVRITETQMWSDCYNADNDYSVFQEKTDDMVSILDVDEDVLEELLSGDLTDAEITALGLSFDPDDGIWYPTNKVQLTINVTDIYVDQLEQVTQLYYFFAPIYLNLYLFVTITYFDTQYLYLSAAEYDYSLTTAAVRDYIDYETAATTAKISMASKYDQFKSVWRPRKSIIDRQTVGYTYYGGSYYPVRPCQLRWYFNGTTGKGVLLEPAATTLRSSTSSGTQTLAAGSYTVSVSGSGSVLLTGGVSATVTYSTPQSFTLSSSTAVTFTVLGTLNTLQLESSTYPTSWIPSALGTRATDNFVSCLDAYADLPMWVSARFYQTADYGSPTLYSVYSSADPTTYVSVAKAGTTITLTAYNAGTSVGSATSDTFDISGTTILLRIGSSSIIMSVGGSTVATLNQSLLSGLDRMVIGRTPSGSMTAPLVLQSLASGLIADQSTSWFNSLTA